MDYSNKTPSKQPTQSKFLRKSCDSSNRCGTPPSRPTRVFNPFESHLIDRLHLPTFSSPNAFATASTPKAAKRDKLFQWTIEEISNLQPADIDESAHHASDDLHADSLLQEKITAFFDNGVVPSPMGELRPARVLRPSPRATTSSAQTELSLPPRLPAELEALLRPFCTFGQDQQQRHDAADALTYKRLFEQAHERAESTNCSAGSSPASPPLTPTAHIQFQLAAGASGRMSGVCARPPECDLSPIGAHSPRLLSFAEMSVDRTSVVPDVDRLSFGGDEMSEASSGSNTPKSGLFASQRKRLSDSFRGDVEMGEQEGSFTKRCKSQFDNLTDNGYQTGGSQIVYEY